jgi:SPP1 family predicted phage head-tail adaptor
MMAGKLRERVTIQAVGTTRVRGGQDLTPTTLVENEPAEVQAVSAMSRFEQERIGAGITHVITVRRSATTAQTQAKGRVVWDGRTLEILTPPTDEGGRREFLRLECQEIRS